MDFRKNLKSELEYSGMLVKELAEKSGVKKNTIDQYLNARNQSPSVETAFMIAQALGVSVEYLVTGKDSSKCTIQTLSKTTRQIAQYAEKLSDKKRVFVLDFIKWLLARKDRDDTFW